MLDAAKLSCVFVFTDDLTTSILPFVVGAGVDPKTLNVLLQKREGNERTFWALQSTLNPALLIPNHYLLCLQPGVGCWCGMCDTG